MNPIEVSTKLIAAGETLNMEWLLLNPEVLSVEGYDDYARLDEIVRLSSAILRRAMIYFAQVHPEAVHKGELFNPYPLQRAHEQMVEGLYHVAQYWKERNHPGMNPVALFLMFTQITNYVLPAGMNWRSGLEQLLPSGGI